MAVRIDHRPTTLQGELSQRSHLIARIHRIEGQVRGLARMVESNEPCLDILTQVSAVKGATTQLGLRLVEMHIVRELAAGDEVRMDRLMLAVDRFSKS
ncbi:MAG: metal-sensitive transcriptional regulator [Candidatus Dormibacteria bacterium]